MIKSEFAENVGDLTKYSVKVLPTFRSKIYSKVELPIDPERTQKPEINKLFPLTHDQRSILFEAGSNKEKCCIGKGPFHIGVVFSGGQAAGGHNVIAGLSHYLSLVDRESKIYGFMNGPKGLINHDYTLLNAAFINTYKNTGGFDMIGSGRDKIETEEDKEKSLSICTMLKLKGLVVIGGDDSNTNAAILAEYFKQKDSPTCVIGVPKTIDGDLRNEDIEMSFGFDSATKTYSELISNIMKTLQVTRPEEYHFIRLMGRSASHITLECALQTLPNLAFISEEVQAENRSLESIVEEIIDLVQKRNENSLNYGVILIPEGLIEFIPEFKQLISEINKGCTIDGADPLSEQSLALLSLLPDYISKSLFLDRDPHGNVLVSQISTEKLLAEIVQKKLAELEKPLPFKYATTFLGYEARSCIPSLFDAAYCFNLGCTAAALITLKCTAYMATIKNLAGPVESWVPGGTSLVSIMNLEIRKGKEKPVIEKYLVDLESKPFMLFKEVRDKLKFSNYYKQKGPIQFFKNGKTDVCYLLNPISEEELLNSDSPVINYLQEKLESSNIVPKILQKKDPLLFKTSKIYREFKLDNEKPNNCYYVFSDNEYMGEKVQFQRPTEDSPDMNICLLGFETVTSITDFVLKGIEYRAREIYGDKLHLFYGTLTTNVKRCKLNELTEIQLGKQFHLFEKDSVLNDFYLYSDRFVADFRNLYKQYKLGGVIVLGAQRTLSVVSFLQSRLNTDRVEYCINAVPVDPYSAINTEISLGFDSAIKTCSTIVGNILTDAKSAKKYWYVIQVSGLQSSRLAMEVGLQAHPNIVLIPELYSTNTFMDIVLKVAEQISQRASMGKNYGAVLIPESFLSKHTSFIHLMNDLKANLSSRTNENIKLFIEGVMKDNPFNLFNDPLNYVFFSFLPKDVQIQLISSRGQNDSLPINYILAHLVQQTLTNNGKKFFNYILYDLDSQCINSVPSPFDISTAYTHGIMASISIEAKISYYCSDFLRSSPYMEKSVLGYAPINYLCNYNYHPHQADAYVTDLTQENLLSNFFKKEVTKWYDPDLYKNLGPIQYHNYLYSGVTKSIQRQTKTQRLKEDEGVRMLEGTLDMAQMSLQETSATPL